MNYHLEIAHKELERVSRWIENADTKAGILLALNGGLLALFVGNIDYFSVSLCSTLGVLNALAFLAATSISVYQAVRVLLPDVKIRDGRKLFFFGTIKTLSSEDYAEQFSSLSESDMLSEILEQSHTNSMIASDKFDHLGRSVKSLGASVITIFLLVGISLLV